MTHALIHVFSLNLGVFIITCKMIVFVSDMYIHTRYMYVHFIVYTNSWEKRFFLRVVKSIFSIVRENIFSQTMSLHRPVSFHYFTVTSPMYTYVDRRYSGWIH